MVDIEWKVIRISNVDIFSWVVSIKTCWNLKCGGYQRAGNRLRTSVCQPPISGKETVTSNHR